MVLKQKLQSTQALYVVSYDYTLEKVVQYTRIALEHVRAVVAGKDIHRARNPGGIDA